MASGINIKLVADVKDFVKGTDNVEDKLKDVSKSLDDVGDDGAKSVGRLEKSFSDATTEASTSAKAMKDGLGRVKEGTKDAEQGLNDFKKEGTSVARETATSFDGSAESIGDVFRDLAANAFEGFGPAGAAAGIAVAAGVGLAIAAFGESEEEAQAAREAIEELGQEMIDSGTVGAVSFGYMVDKLKEMATQTDPQKMSLRGIRKDAELLGVEFDDLANSYAGGTDNIEEQIAGVQGLIDVASEAWRKDLERTGKSDLLQAGAIQLLEDKKASLDKIAAATATAREEEASWYDAGGPQMEAKAELIESINGAYDDAVASVGDFYDEEQKVLDVQAYLDSMQARADALLDYQNAVAASDLTPAQRSALNDLGLDSAEMWMAGYAKATEPQKAQMKKFLTESASDSSGAAKTVIDETFAKPIKATIEPEVSQNDIDAVNRAIDQGISNRKIRVTVEAFNRQGLRVD
jgi:uncharacterized protein YoxC